MHQRINGPALRGLRAWAVAVLAVAICSLAVVAQPPKDDKTKAPKAKAGVSINKSGACAGYTLIAPQGSKKAYLVDLQGRVVNSWDCGPGLSAYLLENGQLLRVSTPAGPAGFGPPGPGGKAFGGGGGAAGRVVKYDWDGKLVWDYKVNDDKQQSHHDACALPNGNVLIISYDKKTKKEAIAAGRKPTLVGDYLLPDKILEVKPTGKTTGEVVWEWRMWDHLIQDHDKSKANYGNVAEHPELIDFNYVNNALDKAAKGKDGDKLKGIGYIGSPTAMRQRVAPDWTHTNSITYNAELNQIAITVHSFSEVWIIDHSTTKAQARGHKGGKSGKGGDLLYRWGNPRTYRAGTAKDQKLFGPHNANWIPKGFPGAGNIIIYNNGMGKTGGMFSSVDEFTPPVTKDGKYERKSAAFGPDKLAWTYAPKKNDFFSMAISGAHRLENGNTLACVGMSGTLVEVTPKGEVVWKYSQTAGGGFGFPGFGGPGGGRPPRFTPPPEGVNLLPGFFQFSLELTEKQKKEIAEFEKSATEKLKKVLTKEQAEHLKPRGFGFGFGPPQAGKILNSTQESRMKLTDEQKKDVAKLQKDADALLAKVLNDKQKKSLKDGPRGFGGPRPPGGPGGMMQSAIFRAYRYGPKFAALVGKELKPGKTIQELEAPKPKGDKPKGDK
jgi:hypothetical protein